MDEKILWRKSTLAFVNATKKMERNAAKKAVVLTRMYAVSLINNFIKNLTRILRLLQVGDELSN